MPPLNGLYSRTAIVVTVALIGIFLSVGLLVAQSFRVTSIQATNNNVRITWDAPGGSNYVVQTAAKPTGTNFTDLSPVMLIPGASVISTNYTHVGGMLNSTSRFYRVRSYSIPPTLQIYPTNAVIGVTMTNRYKVLLVYADNSTQDVTPSATLTVSTNIAQVLGVSTNGFALVRGTTAGTGSVSAVYQSMTNTVALTVAQLTGLYTVPPLSQINDYVNGQSTSVQVMGIFSNGKTNNITPSSTLDGDAVSKTRADYYVAADVANSYALITGQSAANGSIFFTAGGLQTTNIQVTWCKYYYHDYDPPSLTIKVGETADITVTGYEGDGTPVNAAADVTGFYYLNTSILHAQQGTQTVRVTGLAVGTTFLNIYVNNGGGCFTLYGGVDVTVVNP